MLTNINTHTDSHSKTMREKYLHILLLPYLANGRSFMFIEKEFSTKRVDIYVIIWSKHKHKRKIK